MPLDLRREYATNKQAEVEGVWAPIGDDAELKIARFGNPRHTAFTEKLMRPHRAAARAGTVPNKVLEQVTIEAIAEAILLDWKGIQDEGKDVPYSKEASISMLTKYPDFRDQVARLSREIALFQEEEAVEQKGN